MVKVQLWANDIRLLTTLLIAFFKMRSKVIFIIEYLFIYLLLFIYWFKKKSFMVISVPSEGLQNIFELYKQKTTKSKQKEN
jgi:hypothetical protein